jgi:type I restriction enzyme S subunit
MKKGWQTKRIGEIATIKPPKSEARERVAADALVSFLPMEDLGIAIKYPEPKQAKRLSDVVGSYTYFAEGDVLLAKITPCFENGKVGIAKRLKNGIGFGSSEFIVIRPDSTVSNEWLFHFLSREDFRNEGAQRMGGAVGQQRVPKEFVEGYEIPVPPLSEQQRIVGVLDEAFAGLATAEAHAAQNLQNARALFESHLQAVFTQRGPGWVDVTLADVLAVLRNGMNCKQDKSGVGSKVSRIESIWNARFDITRVGYAEIPNAQKDKFLLHKGDVLFSHINSAIHVGKTALFDLEDEVVHGVNLLLMRTKPFVLPGYLDLYLKHIFSAGYWLQVCKQSINQASVNQQDINRVPFRYPDLERQEEIVTQLDALSAETQRLASLYERKRAALEALKKSLLHQAFAGEL